MFRPSFGRRIFSLVVFAPLVVASSAHAATAPNLGVAEGYAVFGKAGVTNDSAAGTTHIWGDVGADASVTNLNDATQVDGTINIPAPGVEAAILSAYGDLAAQGADAALDLAGVNMVSPGVYTVGATTLNGTLTLNGPGIYVFRSSSSITTSGPAVVTLINGATPCNVFWQIPAGITIGAGTQMVGTIITDTQSITMAAGASLLGRALSRIAAVTLDSNQITNPTCDAAAEDDDIANTQRRPIISVTKIPSPLALPGAGSVTYTYEISNPGQYAMNTVTLADDMCSPVEYVSGDLNQDSLLQRTEVWRYRCTSWLTKDTNNVATALGYANGLPAADLAYATVLVGTELPPPLIHVVKIPSRLLVPFGGGSVTYSYMVSNPGVVALHNVQIEDNKCGNVVYLAGDVDDNAQLDMDETWEYRCQSDLSLTTTNTVTVTGTANNQTATDVAFATVVVSPLAVSSAAVSSRGIVVSSHSRSSASSVTVIAPTIEVPLFPNTGGRSGNNGIVSMAVAVGAALAIFVVYGARRRASSRG